MHTVQAVKKGLNDIRANKRVSLLLWGTNLILALAVALPLFGWFGKLSNTSEADVMLRQFSLRLLFEIGYYDFSTLWRMFTRLFLWLILAASLVSTFTSGGVLTVLANPGQEPFLEHFFAGAGRYFFRFLKLLAGVGICAVFVLIAINLVLGGLLVRVAEDGSDAAALTVGLLMAFANLLVAVVFLLILHYARVATVADGLTNMVNTFTRSLVFVFRNLLRTFALIVLFAVVTGLVYLAYWMTRSTLPTTSWLLILVLIAVQQAVVIMRSALQLGLVGAELQLYVLRRPKVEEPVMEWAPEMPEQREVKPESMEEEVTPANIEPQN